MTKLFSSNLARLVLVGMTASAALASDPAHGGAVEKVGVIPTINQAIVAPIVTLVVFAIVLAIIAVKVWPLINKGLSDRENKIRGEIESAEQARKQAKDALDEYQRSLENARAESQKMIETTRAQQGQLAAELKAKADVELGQLRERAMKDIDTAKRAALAEIYSEAVSLASTAAAKILRREVRPEDQRILVEESVRALQAVKN